VVVGMAMIAEWLKIDEERVVQALHEAGERLQRIDDELALDFSSVRRVDTTVIRALEEFAGRADERGVKVVLRDVNVDVYKVLKLVKLARRFSFLSSDAQSIND
jgi:anti-anti-sigma regulatory factor